MFGSTWQRLGFLLWCLVASGIVAGSVIADAVSPLTLLLFFSAVVSCWWWLGQPVGRGTLWQPARADMWLVLGLGGLQLVLLQVFASFPFHYTQDEFITGYTSYTLPSLSQLNWFAAFPPESDWVTQFPVLFFLLQKPFLVLLGPSVESLHVSVWPYDLLVVAFLYLLAREMFGSRRMAVASAIVYIALAPNLYIASYAVHFISSVFFFLASFYFFVLLQRGGQRTHALLCGLCCGLAYLTYPASYLTIPVLLLFAVLAGLLHRSPQPVLRFLPALSVAGVVLLPFAAYALAKFNYFTDRSSQANVLADLPGGSLEQLQAGGQLWQALREVVAVNVSSLYTPGLGGVRDYWFGHQALFNDLTFALLLFGMLVAVVRTIVTGSLIHAAPVAIMPIVFVFGMVLTVPPGAFHRVSLAFPFVALLVVMALETLALGLCQLTGKSKPHTWVFVAGAGLVALLNINSAVTMIQSDVTITGQKDDRYIATFLEQRVPKGTPIYISAFPSYHLQRELFFRTQGAYPLTTKTFPEVSQGLGSSPLILLAPDEEEVNTLRRLYPNGTVVDTVDGFQLEHHLIFLPVGELSAT